MVPRLLYVFKEKVIWEGLKETWLDRLKIEETTLLVKKNYQLSLYAYFTF
jgi:hypothetical protein